jgi:hypothetical protein
MLRRMQKRSARRKDLLAEGLTDGRLRSKAFRSPFHGVHADASVPESVERRIGDAVAILPSDGVIGGWAAAWLHGAKDFDGRRGNEQVPVLICVPRNRTVRARPGVAVLRSELSAEDVTTIRGIPVTSAARTAVDLARVESEAREGVVGIDALWAVRATTGPAVLACLEGRPRLRGAPVAREAAGLAAPGVRSPQETRLRMIWVLDAGLPSPLVNERVTDLEGHHLGRLDLLDEQAGVGAEYDGRGHRSLAVSTVDNVRLVGVHRFFCAETHGVAAPGRPASGTGT